MSIARIHKKLNSFKASLALMNKECRELESLIQGEVSTSPKGQKVKAGTAVAGRKHFISKKTL